LVSEFSKLGYETVSAINGEDALNKLNTEKVQSVISDMKTPKFGWVDVLKAVKEKSPKRVLMPFFSKLRFRRLFP
jgi:DNA-binding NtrC family response regulator